MSTIGHMVSDISINSIYEGLKNNKVNTLSITDSSGKRVYSFEELYIDTLKMIQYLQSLKLDRNKRVGIRATSCYQYILIDLACISLGIQTVPFEIYESSDVNSLVKRFNLSILFTNLAAIDTTQHTKLKSIDSIQYSTLEPDIAFIPESFHDEQVFTTVFSSGTTGVKKAVEVKASCFQDQFENALEMFNMDNDKMLVFLPLNIYLERCYIYLAIMVGFDIAIAEPKFLLKVLKNDKLTFTVGVPHFFEGMMDLFMFQVQSNEELLEAYKKHLQENNSQVFEPFLKFWGGYAKYFLSGSAACKLSVLKFYYNLGIPIYEGYGMSEISGMIALNTPEDLKIGSVGKVFPNKEIKFVYGEIYVKGDFIANTKYFDESDSVNAETFKQDGWVATGDLGYVDEEGYLFLNGRNKNVIVLASGIKVAPEKIEKLLNGQFYIDNSVVIGNEQHTLKALISLKEVGEGIDENQIKEHIQQVNQTLEEHEKIVDFYTINEKFSVENGMLTTSFKLNRKEILKKYSAEINKMNLK